MPCAAPPQANHRAAHAAQHLTLVHRLLHEAAGHVEGKAQALHCMGVLLGELLQSTCSDTAAASPDAAQASMLDAGRIDGGAAAAAGPKLQGCGLDMGAVLEAFLQEVSVLGLTLLQPAFCSPTMYSNLLIAHFYPLWEAHT